MRAIIVELERARSQARPGRAAPGRRAPLQVE